MPKPIAPIGLLARVAHQHFCPINKFFHPVNRSVLPALKGAPLLKRYTLVPIFEEQWVGDRVWYRVGPDQWLEQGNLGLVKPSFPPEGIGPNDPWILNLLT